MAPETTFPTANKEAVGGPFQAAAAGFTTFGNTAVSFWDQALGTLRPVFTHEFLHSVLGVNLGIINRNEWFHEGMATMYQLRFHPQPGYAATLRKTFDQPQPGLPLEQLCNGQPIPLPHYWQAYCRQAYAAEK